MDVFILWWFIRSPEPEWEVEVDWFKITNYIWRSVANGVKQQNGNVETVSSQWKENVFFSH